MPANSPIADRVRRLSLCQCPIHGLTMGQVGLADDERTFIAECPRRDCNVRGTTTEPFGPLTLTPEFRHLLTKA